MISSKKHSYKISPKDIVPGMRLQVKSKDWYLKNRSLSGTIYGDHVGDLDFIDSMSEFCGKTLTVKHVCPYTAFVEVYETYYTFSLSFFEDIDRS